MATQTEDFVLKHYKQLVGRRITSVQRLLPEELDEMMWSGRQGEEAIVIVFDDGDSYALPLADPEGNGPGWLEIADCE